MDAEITRLLMFIIAILTLVGTIQWRNEAKRSRMYERLDEVDAELRKTLKEDYITKEVHGIKHSHMESEIISIKSELNDIKIKVQLIPTISHNLALLMRKNGMDVTE